GPNVTPVSSQKVLLGGQGGVQLHSRSKPDGSGLSPRVLSATPSPRHRRATAAATPAWRKPAWLGGELRRARQPFYLDVLYPARAVNQTVAWRVCGVNSDSDFSGLGGGRPAGWRSTARLSANPAPPTSVQWRLSGSTDGNSSSGRVLLLEPVARAHAGLWVWRGPQLSCHHSWGWRDGWTADEAGVSLLGTPPGPPEIRAHRRQPVLAGTRSSLVCQPSATDPGVPVPEFLWSRYSGDSSAPTVPTVAGTIAHAENSVGRGRASSVALEVVQSPTWLTTSGVADAAAAAAAAGCCAWTAQLWPKPEALTRWFKNGVEIRQADAAATTAIEEGYDPASCTRDSDRYSQDGTPASRFRVLQRVAGVPGGRAAGADSHLGCSQAQAQGGADRQQLVGNLTPESPPSFRYRATLPGVKRTGRYACRARNRLGESSHVIQVVNPGPPEPPTNLTVESTGWDHVLLTWRPGFDGGLPANYSPVGIASTSHTGRFLLASSSTMSALKVTRVGAVRQRDGAAAGDAPTPSRCWPSTLSAAAAASPRPARLSTPTTRELQLPGVGGVRADTGASTLRFDAPPDGLCVRVEIFARTNELSVSADRRQRRGGVPRYRSCELQNRLTGISFVNSYRLSACLLARPEYLRVRRWPTRSSE
uniref:Ig-like domain-containing protein n=1 Tax=Macrostomum lignano TaxID=282301 RepID=A0A1I8F7D5_9PLAT